MALTEDGRPVPVTYRWNPFTGSFAAVLVSDENRVVPGASPFWIRLFEVPRHDDPSSFSCVILVELDEDLDNSETAVDILAAHYGRILVNDVLLVDDEQMQVTDKPGSPTLTVTRGYGGTTPDTHTDGTMMEILNSMTEITSGSPATREFRVDYDYSTAFVLFNLAEQGYEVRFDYWGLGTPLFAGALWHEVNMRNYKVGDLLHPIAQANNTHNFNYAGFTKSKEIKLDRGGDLRIKFDLQKAGAGGSVYGRIYKNGTGVGTIQSTLNMAWVTYSEDTEGWDADDLCQLYVYKDGVANGECRNFQLFIDELIQASVDLDS